jgi:hypothetical protein
VLKTARILADVFPAASDSKNWLEVVQVDEQVVQAPALSNRSMIDPDSCGRACSIG